MKRNIAAAGLVALVAVITASPVFAHDEVRETTQGGNSGPGKALESTVDNVSKSGPSAAEATRTVADRLAEQKSEIENRKTELRTKLEQKVAERKTKLEGRRLAQCQNRQEKVNALLDKSTEHGKRHLANIQQFEARVTEFSHKKAIKTEAIQAALTDADEKEAAAVAVLDVMETQVFDCATLDGAKPADSVHATREEKQAALRAYRDSVIAYLQAVKTAFAQTQSETEATEER